MSTLIGTSFGEVQQVNKIKLTVKHSTLKLSTQKGNGY